MHWLYVDERNYFIGKCNYSNMSNVVYDFKLCTPNTSITVLTTIKYLTLKQNMHIFIYSDMCNNIFFLSSSAVNRNTDFVLCGTKKSCHPHLLIGVSNPTLNKLPCLFVCTHQKLFSPTIYRPRPNVFLPILLLLSGDVSLSPGPTNSNRIRMATVNVRSIHQKSASFVRFGDYQKSGRGSEYGYVAENYRNTGSPF